MQHAVKAMRKKLAEAGDEGVPRSEADNVAAQLKSMLMGPPPPVKVVRRTPTPGGSRLSTPAAAVAAADADGVGEATAEAPEVEAAEVEEAPALDAAFFANLEAFVSPEGGFCGSSAPLATFLAEALAARC